MSHKGQVSPYKLNECIHDVDDGVFHILYVKMALYTDFASFIVRRHSF